MKEILVVELISSGVMYIEEIIQRGYKAFVINPIVADGHAMAEKNNIAKMLQEKYAKDKLEIKFTNSTLDNMLIAIKGHEEQICACVAGSEFGVSFVDVICKVLNLPGNDPNTTKFRVTKLGMSCALKKFGLRYIKSSVVRSQEDIIDFFKNNSFKRVFMKFDKGTGGLYNKVCGSLQESIDFFVKMKNMVNYWGEEDVDVIIQEYIEGPEYVFNTVSCNGVHVISDIWKYKKIENSLGDVLYQSSNLIDAITPEIKNLSDYAFKVLDAVDIKYGPVHAEYKIDQKGPVLIETNCRPMGGSTTRSYMKDIVGNCIVDWVLDALLFPNKFLNKYPNHKYSSIKRGIKKYLILDKETTGTNSTALCIGEHLYSFHNHNGFFPKFNYTFPRTRDFTSCSLILKLADESYDSVKYDLDLMNFIEENYPDLLICPMEICDAAYQHNIEELSSSLLDNSQPIKSAENATRTLVLTNIDAYEVVNSSFAPVCDQTPQFFDQVLYADARSLPMAQKFSDILDLMHYLKPGGKALICQDIAETLPYGIIAFDILKKVARVA